MFMKGRGITVEESLRARLATLFAPRERGRVVPGEHGALTRFGSR